MIVEFVSDTGKKVAIEGRTIVAISEKEDGGLTINTEWTVFHSPMTYECAVAKWHNSIRKPMRSE